MKGRQIDTDQEQLSALLKAAVSAKELSYSPYSGYRVGSAVLTEEGKIYKGANLENVNYAGTICGERSALTVALCQGERRISALAIAGDKGFPYPCGACRQFILEFAPEIDVYVINGAGDVENYPIQELLPHSFTPNNLH